MKEWEKTKESCPFCGAGLERKVIAGYEKAERCSRRCFKYSFEKGKRVY